MDARTEKYDKNNEKSIVSISDGSNKRYHGTCCFGLLSLRTGMCIFSVSSFMLTLYGLQDQFPETDENFGKILMTQTWSKPAFSLLSFCADALGAYGIYKESARAIKYYKRVFCVELILNVTFASTAFITTWKNNNYNLLDPEYLNKWAIETNQDVEVARKMFTFMMFGIFAFVAIPTTAYHGYQFYLAGKYQRFLEEREKTEENI